MDIDLFVVVKQTLIDKIDNFNFKQTQLLWQNSWPLKIDMISVLCFLAKKLPLTSSTDGDSCCTVIIKGQQRTAEHQA